VRRSLVLVKYVEGELLKKGIRSIPENTTLSLMQATGLCCVFMLLSLSLSFVSIISHISSFFSKKKKKKKKKKNFIKKKKKKIKKKKFKKKKIKKKKKKKKKKENKETKKTEK
jgi:Na+-transporting methylmalonyl-CoA/oxaloacetate decarboxylase gamma subunit